jgi:hypothetical protein
MPSLHEYLLTEQSEPSIPELENVLTVPNQGTELEDLPFNRT